MFTPIRRLRRLALMAPLLLILLLSSSQPQAALAYSPIGSQQIPVTAPVGFIDISIWAKVLAYDGYLWVEAWTPMDNYFMTMTNVGWGEYYSYEMGSGATDDLRWTEECGWFLEWDVNVNVTAPPQCKLTVNIEARTTPGICWGQIAGVPFFDFVEPDTKIGPGVVTTTFLIGQEIFQIIHYGGTYIEGDIYVLLTNADLYGGPVLGGAGCNHHAFRP